MIVKSTELATRLERLLSESKASVLDRETHTLERIIGSLDGQFILFGAGNLGRKVARILRTIEKTPAAFMDNNPSLWGKDVEGIRVMSPAEAAGKFDPEQVGVITTIWFGEATDRMSDRIHPLLKLGFKRIALFGHLAWKFPLGLLPHYSLDKPSKILDHSPAIRTAFHLLADDESREIFVDHIEWRLFLDYDVLPPPSDKEIYFNDKYVTGLDTEVLYDIGAFTGDSTKSFLATTRGTAFKQIHAFEPSPNNYQELEQFVASSGYRDGKIFAHRLALGDRIGETQVETDFGPSSRVGRGNVSVPITTIDAISSAIPPPTFIKIDVEGFEPQCLKGAERIISQMAPAIAVSVYHIQSHLWEILLQLHGYYSHYNFRLCPHVADGWDLVLYAVPKNRVPG